ncbi:hypothetical protein FGB62_81g00 [Gracilaria domingensis]|nr:hypothetical protein FGB62_81g00 [Gracilaria domingensis]
MGGRGGGSKGVKEDSRRAGVRDAEGVGGSHGCGPQWGAQVYFANSDPNYLTVGTSSARRARAEGRKQEKVTYRRPAFKDSPGTSRAARLEKPGPFCSHAIVANREELLAATQHARALEGRTDWPWQWKSLSSCPRSSVVWLQALARIGRERFIRISSVDHHT